MHRLDCSFPSFALPAVTEPSFVPSRKCSNSAGNTYGLGSFFIVDDLASKAGLGEVPAPWKQFCGVVEGFCDGKGDVAARPQV